MRERARIELGQPARKTLDALIALDAEANRLGFDRERVAILLATSQAYGRLGDQRTAERIASEGVSMAEKIGDPALLGDALNRLGTTVLSEAPGRAYAIYARALALYESIGDVRGQARIHGNLGIAAQFESRLEEAFDAFGRAIAVARVRRNAGSRGARGAESRCAVAKVRRVRSGTRAVRRGAGVVRGGEAQRVSARGALQHGARRARARSVGFGVRAVRGDDSARAADRAVGHRDRRDRRAPGCVRSSWAGSTRRAGALRDARASGRATVRNGTRDARSPRRWRSVSWSMDGRPTEAFGRFASAISLAESSDVYNAAWLTVACADALVQFDCEGVKSSILSYRDRVRRLGYAEMTRRYEALAQR